MSSDARPLARDDIDAAPRVIDDETVYFIGDPVKNEYKQLDELQYEVFRRLDGRRSVAQIAKELYDEYEVEVSTEELSEFISGLGEMNLLDPSSELARRGPIDPEVGRAILARLALDGVVFSRRGTTSVHLPPGKLERRRRHDEAALVDAALAHLERGDLRETAKYLRSVLEMNPRNFRARHLLHEVLSAYVGNKVNFENIFFWRVPVVNPERLLSMLDRMLGRLFFNRLFLIIWFALMGLACFLLVIEADRAVADFRYVLSFRWMVAHPAALPLMWVFGVFSTASHEVAHGLTCRHFGGRVREMGILFAYLGAGAYCDISSSYLIQDRWQRAFISLAGVIWNLVCWAIAVLIWAVVRTDTTLGVFAFVVVLNLPGYLANWNPVVRTDGYLALTDLLNYPNLRDDAFTYLRLRLDQLLLGSSVELPPELAARSRLYLWYAVPGIAGTAVFVGASVYLIASTLIEQLQTIGVVISAFIVYVSVWALAWKGIKAVWARRHQLWRSRRFRRITFAASSLLVMLVVMPWPLRIEAPCETHPIIVPVRSPERNAVEKYFVEHGERVSKGQLLLQLSDDALVVRLARSSAELRSAELDLQKLNKRVRDEEIGVAQAKLAGQRAVLRASQRSVQRLRRLTESNLVSQKTLDAVIAQREQARTRVVAANEDVQVLSADALAAEVSAAEALVDMLRAQVNNDQRRLDVATIRSPAAGYVLLPRGQTAVELTGVVVEEGQELLRVRKTGGEQLELHLPITEPIGELSAGDKVVARLRGLANEKLEGKLVKLGATMEVSERGGTLTTSVMRAEVSLDDETATLGLPKGLSGEAYVTAGWYPLAYHAYLRLVRLILVDVDRVLEGLD